MSSSTQLFEMPRWMKNEMTSESKSIIQEITEQDRKEFKAFLEIFLNSNREDVSGKLFSWLDKNKLDPNKLFQLLKKHRAEWNEKTIPSVEALATLFNWSRENVDIAPLREVIQCCGPLVCDVAARSRDEKLIEIFVENEALIDPSSFVPYLQANRNLFQKILHIQKFDKDDKQYKNAFDINAFEEKHGGTLLHVFVRSDEISFADARFLLEMGASINQEDITGRTPFDWIIEELKNKNLNKEKEINLLDKLIFLLDELVLKNSEVGIKNNNFLNKFIFMKGASALAPGDLEIVEKLIVRVNEISKKNKSGSVSMELAGFEEELNDTLANMKTLLKAMKCELQGNKTGAMAYYTELALQNKRIPRVKIKDLSLQDDTYKATAGKWSKEECVFIDIPESHPRLELKSVQALETKDYPVGHVDKMLNSCDEKTGPSARLKLVEDLVSLDSSKLTGKDAGNIMRFLALLVSPTLTESILSLEFTKKLYYSNKLESSTMKKEMVNSLRRLFLNLRFSPIKVFKTSILPGSVEFKKNVDHYSVKCMMVVLDDENTDEKLKEAMCKIISLIPGALDYLIELEQGSELSKDAQKFLNLASQKYSQIFSETDMAKIKKGIPDLKYLMLCEVESLYGKIMSTKFSIGLFTENKSLDSLKKAAQDVKAAVNQLFVAVSALPNRMNDMQNDEINNIRQQIGKLTIEASGLPDGVITDGKFFESLGQMNTLIKNYFPRSSSPSAGIKTP